MIQRISDFESKRLVLSCLVLSCLVLSCLVLSCLVLSCLVLSCLVLSCLVLSCLVLSCLVLSCLVLSCLVLSCLVLSCLVLSCLVLSCLVLSCVIGVTDILKVSQSVNQFDWLQSYGYFSRLWFAHLGDLQRISCSGKWNLHCWMLDMHSGSFFKQFGFHSYGQTQRPMAILDVGLPLLLTDAGATKWIGCLVLAVLLRSLSNWPLKSGTPPLSIIQFHGCRGGMSFFFSTC